MKLKPCPFCGEDKARVGKYDDDSFVVRCDYCAAVKLLSFYSGYITREFAAEAWNRRA